MTTQFDKMSQESTLKYLGEIIQASVLNREANGERIKYVNYKKKPIQSPRIYITKNQYSRMHN